MKPSRLVVSDGARRALVIFIRVFVLNKFISVRQLLQMPAGLSRLTLCAFPPCVCSAAGAQCKLFRFRRRHKFRLSADCGRSRGLASYRLTASAHADGWTFCLFLKFKIKALQAYIFKQTNFSYAWKIKINL